MISPNNLQDMEKAIQKDGTRPKSRFVGSFVSEKPNMVVSKFMQEIQKQNSKLSKFTRREKGNANTFWNDNKSPLDILNKILCSVNLPVVEDEVQYDEDVQVINNGDKYSITQLSDGERAAILIAAEIITAPRNAMILIDEPDRHLHRSITSPLMQELFAERRDCCFILSTHDITLPTDNLGSRTLLVRGCEYDNNAPTKWDIDRVEPDSTIDEATRADILGSRHKLLFVEGKESSLDKQLYRAVLPNVSVIPRGGFNDVEQTVKNIRESEEYHWLEVYGLIDKDERVSEDIINLESSGIYSLPVRSVESLYYSQEMLEMVMKYTPHLKSKDTSTLLEKAKREAVTAFAESINYMCKLIAEHEIRCKMLDKIPSRKDSTFLEPININLEPKQMVSNASEKLREFVDNKDFDTLIATYPVGKTAIPSRIAQVLNMNKKTYEQTVCQMVRENSDARDYVIKMLGSLYQVITGSSSNSVPVVPEL